MTTAVPSFPIPSWEPFGGSPWDPFAMADDPISADPIQLRPVSGLWLVSGRRAPDALTALVAAYPFPVLFMSKGPTVHDRLVAAGRRSVEPAGPLDTAAILDDGDRTIIRVPTWDAVAAAMDARIDLGWSLPIMLVLAGCDAYPGHVRALAGLRRAEAGVITICAGNTGAVADGLRDEPLSGVILAGDGVESSSVAAAVDVSGVPIVAGRVGPGRALMATTGMLRMVSVQR